jgi:hypothetical protein
MLIGGKSRHNHYLNMCFLHHFLYKKIECENKLIFLHMIKSNILFHKFPKYEIISLTLDR